MIAFSLLASLVVVLLKNKFWMQYWKEEPKIETSNVLIEQPQNNDNNNTNSKAINHSETEELSSQEDEWKLILVNRWNPISDNDDVYIVELDNGQSIDERCYPDLQNMMDDCRQAGLLPVICSSYRTRDKQNCLFQNHVDQLLHQQYNEEDARAVVATYCAVPGTSEHELGLALDIVDYYNQNLDETQVNTGVQQWLMQNSWKYGFILRYPENKSGITGIIFEPWHYRYVGKEVAKEIFEQGLCLEEYLDK